MSSRNIGLIFWIFAIIGFLAVPNIDAWNKQAGRAALAIYQFGLLGLLSFYLLLKIKNLLRNPEQIREKVIEEDSEGKEQAELNLVDTIIQNAKNRPLIAYIIILISIIIVTGNVVEAIGNIMDFLKKFL